MPGLEDLAQSLLGEQAQAEIAAANPWYKAKGVSDLVGSSALQLVSQDPTRYKTKDAVIATGLSGLLSGLIGSYGDKYQNTLTDRYVDAVTGSLGGDATAESSQLPDALFGSAKRRAALFAQQRLLQAAEDQREVAKAGALEKAKKLGELGAYGADSSGGAMMLNPINKEKLALANQLRDEIAGNQTYKDYAAITPSLKAMVGYANSDTLTSDLPFVYELVKVLDPGSVVREGEISLAQGARSPLAAFQGALSAVAGGSRMTPDVKQQLLELALQKGKYIRDQYNQVITPKIEMAKRYGIAPEDLTISMENSAAIPDIASIPDPLPGESKAEYFARVKGG